MKNEAIQGLKDSATEAKRKRYPNVPAHALPRATHSDKDANGLTRCIIDFVNLQPACMAWRSGNAPVYDAKIGRHRSGNVRKGVADISAIREGRAWQIEVKIGKDRLSEPQQDFAANVQAAGGVYCVAYSFAQFLQRWHDPDASFGPNSL